MIRPATPDDLTAIRAIAVAAYAPYIPVIGRKPAPMAADYAAQIAEGWVHVADPTGTGPVGFVVFYPAGDTMFLENIAVSRAAVGQGIGKALMAFCETQARQTGMTAITLYTNALMTDNLRIYPHLGYVQTDRRTEDGFDRVYFRKDLRLP
ncbi:GNAT family N-acetyltransferase [Puniceibacterium sediminis]|uniref:Ribosomal protein S18 acetylase RimI n=1 Tax=Puniceibacterium sediminis TaxID=1608407 RepID=A0A238XBI3_9RHOB|nr:GNAT family N-acetyltransferase [Puniceibacterium sediminis]SNR56396.1 Ribosomal protein S18 acetylase RimI [Puniceibacterium sediminis]